MDTIGLAESEIGNEGTANMVMLGAILRITGVVEKAAMAETFEKLMTEEAKLIEPNMKAIEAWEG